MKKSVLSLFLLIAFLFSLSACNKNNHSTASISQAVKSIADTSDVPPEELPDLAQDLDLESETESEPESDLEFAIESDLESETAPEPEAEPEPTTDLSSFEEQALSENQFLVGNIVVTCPEGFSVADQSEDGGMVAFTSEDNDCAIGLFAFDISFMSEESAMAFLPGQHSTFIESDAVRISEDDLECTIAGFPVIIDGYGNAASDPWYFNFDTTFTDSWYSYTMLFRCPGENEFLDQYTTAFVDLLVFSEYRGEDPRFDFVQ